MKRNPILVLAVSTALLLAAGIPRPIVLAKSIARGGGKCVGTERRDLSTGSAGADQIAGRDGNDVIRGGAGNDQIGDAFGENPDIDQIFGGKGDDVINVAEGDGSEDFGDCGRGEDDVAIDERDVVKNCEIVDRL
jgi:hypothetical protein